MGLGIRYKDGTRVSPTMNQEGLHVLVHGYTVPRECMIQITDINHGRPVWDRIIYHLQCSIVAQTGHTFSHGRGYCYTYLLEEGHMTVHTYPERRAFFVDLFYEQGDHSEAIEVIHSAFDGARFSYQIIQH